MAKKTRDRRERPRQRHRPPGNAPAPPARYVEDPTLPAAWLVDIDGTLAHMSDRSPFHWHRVGEDAVSPAVEAAVRAFAAGPDRAAIVLLSGRDGVCRPETEEWLARHDIPYDELYMRPAGDNRKDSIVKAELFDRHIRHRYRIIAVLDDRDQVVRMWRRMGLVCFQVAEGDF
ncbi:polynucleotide kinase [Rhodococcus pyridinivorans]|uniref:phosphatase domain-containing protein n=1 Tax=Rhodococcus pyridinivorans TaxID=103816 RepID=UPI0020C717B9|nr:polynucleotide kinase [Rhodococcus pyridinivorans]UTM38365.1 polynucleotide kinase [Rhodococcus pyridinivorans]